MNRHVSSLFLFFLALMLFVLPIQWVFAAILAAIFHELCHYFAVRLCGGKVFRVSAGVFGARMDAAELTVGRELLCALAGPAGSLFLILFARWFPRIAVCAGFQGIYNLLPIYPLDGGRAVRCFAELIIPIRIGHRICDALELLCMTGMVFLGLYGCFALHLGLFPLLVGLGVVLRRFHGKIPCKPWGNSVQ